MKSTYPAIITLCSFLLVFGSTLFLGENSIFGWVIGVIGGAGAMLVAHEIGENREK